MVRAEYGGRESAHSGGGTRPDVRALDIVNLAPATQTEFDRNRCLTALNAPCPAIVP